MIRLEDMLGLLNKVLAIALLCVHTFVCVVNSRKRIK